MPVSLSQFQLCHRPSSPSRKSPRLLAGPPSRGEIRGRRARRMLSLFESRSKEGWEVSDGAASKLGRCRISKPGLVNLGSRMAPFEFRLLRKKDFRNDLSLRSRRVRSISFSFGPRTSGKFGLFCLASATDHKGQVSSRRRLAHLSDQEQGRPTRTRIRTTKRDEDVYGSPPRGSCCSANVTLWSLSFADGL